MAKHPTASDMGKLGGPARAAALTEERRKQIARLGGLARAAKLKNGTAPKSTAPTAPHGAPPKHGSKKKGGG